MRTLVIYLLSLSLSYSATTVLKGPMILKGTELIIPGTSSGPYLTGTSPPESLYLSLVSHWQLNEASGTRDDIVGGNDLASGNSARGATAFFGNGLSTEGGNGSGYVSIADNTSLSFSGLQDMTICGWFYPTNAGSGQIVVAKSNIPVNGEWGVTWGVNSRLGAFLDTNGAPSYVTIEPSVTNAFNAWHFFVMWFDASLATLNIQVDNGTAASVVAATGFRDSNGAFTIGGTVNQNGGGTACRIDSVSFFRRKLSTAERTYLYNGGSGRDYPF